MPSAVLDTNVLVSGMLNREGIPGRIVDAAIGGRFDLVTSRLLIREFRWVIRKPKIANKYRRIRNERRQIEHFLKAHSVGTPPRFNPPVVAQHPEDDRVLECAKAGRVDYIVSGNRHLLALGRFEGISICAPKKFARKMGLEA